MNLDITQGVRAFRDTLSASWPIVKLLSMNDLTGSFLDDWMQGNWERIVECSISPSLKVVLEPYGEGADCNIKSSRVWNPHLLPNGAVYARYIGNDILINAVDGNEVTGSMKLGYFCTIRDEWPVIDSPFDYLVLEGENTVAIPVKNLEYYVGDA
jgi:hypothetical protein